MLDQLPEWIQQAHLHSQLPSWMQDPPPKKKSTPDIAGTLGWLNEKLKGLGPKAVEQVKGMAQEAVSGRYPFIGMVGPGELGAATPGIKVGLSRLLKELTSEGGATLTAAGKRFAGSGFAVADPALTTIVHTPEEMRAFLKRPDVAAALKAGKHIGKWTNPETKATEINITDILPDQKAALKLAADRGEQALGHLQNGEYLGDITNPHAPVQGAKDLLMQMNGGKIMPRVTEVPPEAGKRLANVYESLPKNDPAAKSAYDALNKEVADQYAAIQKAGYKIEFVDADPYKNSAEMMKDVRENKTLKVFKTPRPPEKITAAAVRHKKTGEVFTGLNHASAFEGTGPHWEDTMWDYDQGFTTNTGRFVSRQDAVDINLQRPKGTAGPTDKLRAEEVKGLGENNDFHPYMTPEQNDRFRAVHDFLAHAGWGNQFGVKGEENAFRAHASTLSELAQQALATETRGQNSWVNFGPNAHLPVKERPFAEQKAALWPKELLGDYSEMPKPAAPNIIIPGGDAKTPLKLAERFKDSPADVSARVQQALDVLRQPVTPWEPTPRGLLDRSLIEPDDLSKAGPPVLPHERVAPKTDRKAMGHLVSLAAPENIDLIQRQIRRGEQLGGPTFYPSFRAIDDAIGNAGGDPELFRHATSAGSARNSIHNEQSVGSAIMYALKRGVIDLDAIAQAQAKGPQAVLALSKKVQGLVEKDFPDSKGLPLMPTHLQIFRQLREGIPPTGSYKIPTYSAQKAGHLFGWVGDTHEATGGTLGSPYHRYFSEHGGFEPEEYGPAEGLFSDVAMQLGLTPRAGQASRWMGGGELTGLKSAMGDAAQHLEDNVFWNAKERGLDPKTLLKSVARGDNILFPYFKKGRLPLY